MAVYCPSSSFACLWTETAGVEFHKLAKKNRLISSHLDRTNLVNKGFIVYGFRGNFSCGTRRVVPSGQDSFSLPPRVVNGPIYTGDGLSVKKDHRSGINTGKTM